MNGLINTSPALGITLFGFDATPRMIPGSLYYAVQLSLYSLSIVTTVLSTAIIVIRILMVARLPGTSRRPRIAMEIIVESALLYSISALVYTPMLADSSPDASVATYYLYAQLFFAYMAVECPS